MDNFFQFAVAAFDQRQIAAEIQFEVKGDSASDFLLLPTSARALSDFPDEAVQIHLAKSFMFAASTIELADSSHDTLNVLSCLPDVPERISQLTWKVRLMFQQNFGKPDQWR